MPDRFVRLARTRLDVTNLDLARNLGVTVGCLRSWDRKGAPRYVQLALCALIAGIEPEAVERSPTLAARNRKAHLPAHDMSWSLLIASGSYARFLSRFRLPISAISIGPSVNSPASAFRVSSRKYPPALAIAAPFCRIAATTIAAGSSPMTDLRRLPGAGADSEHRADDRRDAKEIAPVRNAALGVVDNVRAGLEDHPKRIGLLWRSRGFRWWLGLRPLAFSEAWFKFNWSSLGLNFVCGAQFETH